MKSDPVTVIHHVNGSVKTCTLWAPHISKSMADGGVAVFLRDRPDGPETGAAFFTRGGIVLVCGAAVEQYSPLTQPEKP